MRRYFYKDPLAAEWMANKFGMEFVADDGRELYIADFGFDFKRPKYNDRGPEKAYIHPDSLRIFDPQTGDLMTNLGVRAWRLERLEPGENKTKLIFCNGFVGWNHEMKTIQRNGIAFLWPDSEAA